MLQRTLVVIVWLVLAGCSMNPSAPASTRNLYERLGGKAAITAVVDDAVANIAADPRINRRFANANIPHLKTNLVDFLCARSGGPCTYTGRNMSDAHEGMNIRDDEYDALVQDLVKSLDKFNVGAREKGELGAMLAQMRNAVTGH
ncbi:MAG: group 1 truncated hemoglobin [Caldimonas sp.]